jgi:hypothetical protein
MSPAWPMPNVAHFELQRLLLDEAMPRKSHGPGNFRQGLTLANPLLVPQGIYGRHLSLC